MNFERVTFTQANGRGKTVLLGKVALMEDGRFLIGTEVTHEGDTRWFNKGTTERVHVIELACITRRQPLRLDLTYCELVDA
jgi:hypothetical protein